MKITNVKTYKFSVPTGQDVRDPDTGEQLSSSSKPWLYLKLETFADDWRGHYLRGPTEVAFAGANRDILLAASLDNLVVHRFDNVGVCGLQLNHPKL